MNADFQTVIKDSSFVPYSNGPAAQSVHSVSLSSSATRHYERSGDLVRCARVFGGLSPMSFAGIFQLICTSMACVSAVIMEESPQNSEHSSHK